MKLKIIEIKIYLISYILYNKSIIINIIVLKLMLPKFLGLICNNKKQLNND
jgi:hypothetical protein